MVNNVNFTCDIGLFLIFVIFLCLKLAGAVAWSWWIITLPLWIIPALFIIFLIIMGVVITLAMIIAAIVDIFS